MLFTRSGSAIHWPLYTGRGGEFRLCWCSGFVTCSFAKDFRIDLGTLTLLGPNPLSQDTTCVPGLTCTLRTTGTFGTNFSHYFAVFDTCGLSSQNFQDFYVEVESVNAVSVWSVSPVAMSISGGQYRLCWCAGLVDVVDVFDDITNSTDNSTSQTPQTTPSNLSNPTPATTCRTASDYRVDFGGLLMLGATSIYNDFTCISGQLCELDDVVRGFVQDQDCFVQTAFKHSQTFMANLWWSKPSPFCGFSKDEYEIYTI